MLPGLKISSRTISSCTGLSFSFLHFFFLISFTFFCLFFFPCPDFFFSLHPSAFFSLGFFFSPFSIVRLLPVFLPYCSRARWKKKIFLPTLLGSFKVSCSIVLLVNSLFSEFSYIQFSLVHFNWVFSAIPTCLFTLFHFTLVILHF